MDYVDYRRLRLDESGRITRPAGFKFDFNAIAQGYAVDLLGNYLKSQGIEIILSIGGEVLGKGAEADASRGIVGIENPAATASQKGMSALKSGSQHGRFTSGNYPEIPHREWCPLFAHH